MKPTKKNTITFVKMKLATDSAWALRALVRIFQENQTANEQIVEATNENNGIGFTGTDGNFLSSLAKQYIARGTMSVKQMTFVFRKMPKYARQVIAFSDAAKLEKMVEKASLSVILDHIQWSKVVTNINERNVS